MYLEEPARQQHRSGIHDSDEIELNEVCSHLDPVQMCKVFMVLLSKQYINQNAPSDFHLEQDSYPVALLIRLCHMNSMVFDKIELVKKLIIPLLDLVTLAEVSGPSAHLTLHILY